jgi:hypothetical protein
MTAGTPTRFTIQGYARTRMPRSNADVAQLVERRLPKPKVAGSRPVVRFPGLSVPRTFSPQIRHFAAAVAVSWGHAPTRLHRLAGAWWSHLGRIGWAQIQRLNRRGSDRARTGLWSRWSRVRIPSLTLRSSLQIPATSGRSWPPKARATGPYGVEIARENASAGCLQCSWIRAERARDLTSATSRV